MHSALSGVDAGANRARGYKNPDSSYCYNVGLNPANSDLFAKIDDLHCGWDRRGGPLDEGTFRCFLSCLISSFQFCFLSVLLLQYVLIFNQYFFLFSFFIFQFLLFFRSFYFEL